MYRKKDLKVHPAAPKTICFEEDGDRNPYFDDPLILRTYLKAIEPRWKRCISTIEHGVADEETKWIVAGYIAFLRACSPTMRRVGTTMLEALVETTRPSVARYVQANTPQQDHAEQVVATLLHPSVYVSVDAQYPKALGITSLIAIQKRYWESPWLILRNDAEIPFLTSDYPANPYYHNNEPQRFHVYVPLTPQHALLITPLPDTERMHAHAQDSYGIVKRQQIKLFNRIVVQCAENVVLSDRQSP